MKSFNNTIKSNQNTLFTEAENIITGCPVVFMIALLMYFTAEDGIILPADLYTYALDPSILH